MLLLAIILTVLPGPLRGREVQSLNGAWRFRIDRQDAGRLGGWAKAAPSDSREVTMPSIIESSGESGPSPAAWLWREFRLPAAWKTRNIRLRFRSLACKGEVWVNGGKSGDGDPVRPTATFDITKSVSFDGNNLVAVRLEAGRPFDWGDSWKECDLLAADEAHITDIAVDTKAGGWVTVRVEMNNTSEKSGDAQMVVEITERSSRGKRVASAPQHVRISPGKNRADVMLRIRSPRLPTDIDPALYFANVSFRQDRDILDNDSESFHFPAPPP